MAVNKLKGPPVGDPFGLFMGWTISRQSWLSHGGSCS